jgi:formylglycine-generating enzyme required for sulfatase activity
MFCPIANRGPQLLEIPSPAGGIYCIDRTEVSSIHYAAFLESSPDTGDQPAACAFNTTFAPETSADCDPLPYDPQSARPVTCVDWCDARKFCEWAGKELCGAIGGGPVVAADYADPAHDAWFSACSENGQREFPYGNDYDGLSCGGLDYPSTSPLAVATLSQCEGGYNGLWDMSGNVSEWENSCDGSSGASDECLHRGGGLFDADETPVTLRCNSVGSDDPLVPATHPRDRRHEFLGFRCCSFP